MKVPDLSIQRWADGHGAFSNRFVDIGEVVEICPVRTINTIRERLPDEIKTIVYSHAALTGEPVGTDNTDENSKKTRFTVWCRSQLRKIPFLPKIAKFVRSVQPEKPQKLVIAFGYGSMYNHSDDPNLKYELSDNHESMRYTALKEIQEGEQLTISYYHPAGEKVPSNGSKNDWFSGNGIVKIDL